MQKSDVPNNSIVFSVEILDDEEVCISTGHKFDEDMDEDSVHYWTSILLAIHHLFSFNPDFLSNQGDLLKYLAALESDDEDEDEIVFEPAEELIEAIEDKKKNSKVVNIKSRMN